MLLTDNCCFTISKNNPQENIKHFTTGKYGKNKNKRRRKKKVKEISEQQMIQLLDTNLTH
jgi:hypothetical protein